VKNGHYFVPSRRIFSISLLSGWGEPLVDAAVRHCCAARKMQWWSRVIARRFIYIFFVPRPHGIV